MKLEVGMYVRTPYGIDKIKDIILNGNLYEDSGLYLEKGIKLVCGKEEMKKLKASHNIIDLIQVGDYVNGYKLLYQDSHYSYFDTDTCDWIYIKKDEQIKSIVTKEMFSNVEYKVETN